jgi:N6-adenosine-specific RNA methylase IME4
MSFRALVADPPWRFRDRLPGATRGAERQYPTLSVQEIMRFPLPPMADDAVLFLWRVSALTEEAYQVTRAWGFTPKTEIVWVKTRPPKTSAPESHRLHFGMGRYVRAAHETVIVAVRGRPAPYVKSRSVRSVFFANVTRHSSKPSAFYELVESLVLGPYAELFARVERPGWSCWGNEIAMAAPVP